MAKKGGWFGEKVRHSEAAIKGKAKKLLGNYTSVREGYLGELEDIDEGGYFCVGKKPFIDNVLKDNIKYILKRDGLWKKGMDIVFPPGALSEIECHTINDSSATTDFYQYDFMVYINGEQVYRGTAYGSGICDTSKYEKTGDECDSYFVIMDMTIETEEM